MPSHQGRRLFSCYRKRRCKSCMPCSLYRREEEESETCEVRRTCARDIRLSTSEYPLQKLLPLDFFHRNGRQPCGILHLSCFFIDDKTDGEQPSWVENLRIQSAFGAG